MYYKLLNPGDRVLTITAEFLAIEHNDGSVDFYPIFLKENKIHLDTDAVTIIGYTPNDGSTYNDEYVIENGVHIINF